MEIESLNKDKLLIEQFLNGNDRAFNELIKRHQKSIYWHARRMLGNHLDADEVTQQVIIVLYKKLTGFNFQSSLKTWIYKITSNLCINMLKTRKIRKFLSFDDHENSEAMSGEDIISNYEFKEKLETLNEFIQKLPIKQKQVFILRHFDELSYKEISEITGKSIGGLKANYFHAASKIFEFMKNEKP